MKVEPFKLKPRSAMSEKPGVSNKNAGWGTFVIDRFDLTADRSPKMMARTGAYLIAQEHSGAGFAADKALRSFQLEYSGRALRNGPMSMPSSFEAGCAFFGSSPRFAALTLLPEIDHLVSFSDFLDFVTGDEGPELDVAKAYKLTDSVIYNINSLERADDLLLSTESSSSYGFAAASMVRRMDELTVMLVLGEDRPAEETEKLRDSVRRGPGTLNPGKGFLNKIDTSQDNRLLLEGSSLGRTVAFVRFNLKERRMDLRMLMREFTNMFQIDTDSVVAVPPDNETYKPFLEGVQEKLNNVASVWEIAKTMVLLPAYLLKRITLLREEVRDTPLKAGAKTSMKMKKALANSPDESRVLIRRIAAVRVERAEPAKLEGRAFCPPQFQVPVDGYWRFYGDPTVQGHDQDGNVVDGKTWVKAHVRWKDKEAHDGPKVVYLKSSLGVARARLEGYRAAMGTAEAAGVPRKPENATKPVCGADDVAGQQGDREGEGLRPSAEVQEHLAADEGNEAAAGAAAYLYVMRCPAHGRDIYKVGYTDRDPEVRAQELSSATGSPTHFLVVQAWAVVDGQAAEMAAHEALNGHRLSDRREFFKAPYQAIRKGIEARIGEWEIT